MTKPIPKILLISFVVFSCSNVFSQITDTLRISYSKAIYLVFSETPVYHAGSEDEGVEEISVKPFGDKLIIQALLPEGFKETNMFVQSGKELYMFILVYDKNPTKFLYNYQVTEKSGSTVPTSSTSTPQNNTIVLPEKSNEMIDYGVVKEEIVKKEKEKEQLSKEQVIYQNCHWVLDQPQKLFSNGTIENNTTFLATNLYVYENQFYFKIIVKNNSKINYDIDFIKFTIRNKNKGVKKSGDQDIDLEEIFVLNKDKMTVPGQEKNEYVYVFPKFTIENNKKLFIEIWEKNGDRKIDFGFSSNDILTIKRID